MIICLIRRSLSLQTLQETLRNILPSAFRVRASCMVSTSKKYRNLIENVQILATKYVDGFKDLDYPDRLRILELPTLMYRRARVDDKVRYPNHFGQKTR